MATTRKPVLLVIRDGWGKNPDPAQNPVNAVFLAKKACDDALQKKYPHTLIAASGLDVGLPDGVMGNSEVGHENIGAGRIVDQELVRLNKLFSEKRLAANPTWRGVVERVKTRKSRLHLMGIVSDAGVHGMLEHLYGILRQAKEDGIRDVFIHAFTDGRDTPPQSGLGYVKQVDAECKKIGVGQIATVCGRFWAMDRDNRWERVQKAYDLLTGRKAVAMAPNAAAAVQQYYDAPLTATQKGDEFVAPTAITGPDGKPLAVISNGDAVLFYNYRGDRPREITKAFVLDDFKGFDRGPKLDLYYATMTEYETGLPVHVVAMKPPPLKSILGQVVSDAGIAQFRCAETEKNPHVTFFFNNYRSEPFPGEDRAMPPSPKVATYDLQPEMSAAAVTELVKAAILSGKYGFLVVNYANPDMVGHTGSLPAAIKAVEAADHGVGELLGALEKMGGKAVICADHGNAEQMWDFVHNAPHTSHTLNLVEVFVAGDGLVAGKTKMRQGGRLADIAPTVLALMGLPKPAEMTGENLVLPGLNAPMKTRFRVTFWALALLLAGSLRAQTLWLDTRAGMKVEDVQKLHPEAHEPPEPGELPAGHGKDLLEIDETVVAGHTFRVRFFFNDENQLVHVDLFETGEILLKEFNRLRDLVREKYGMEYSTTNSASIRLDWHVARTVIQLQWAPLQHGVVTISISYDAPIPKETERL